MPVYTYRGCLVLLVLLLFSVGCHSSSETDPTAGREGTGSGNPLQRTTLYGQLEGVESDYDSWAWLGVPFAKPPTGDLRWRAPRDPDPWEGIRMSDEFGGYCAQYGNYISETGPETLGDLWGDGILAGTEDCLYLNLWRPRSSEQGLPVYIFIHGGANFIGRSDVSIYNGAHFASQGNMIFISINYRLGYLGWFTHPALREGDPLDDSGNYGTLDIIKALEWVRDNIAAFGGDPDNVTVTGQSAGGINTYSLLSSPLAKGLFHKAVIHSGLPWSCPMGSATSKATTVLHRLVIQDGYAGTRAEARAFIDQKEDAWIREYLRSKTLPDLFAPENGAPTGLAVDKLLNIPAMLGVYVDGHVIPKSPLQCLASGEYNRVPLMMGCTTEEFKLFLPLFLVPPHDLWEFVRDYDPDQPAFDLKEFLPPPLWPVLFVYEPFTALGKTFFQRLGVDQSAQTLSQHQQEIFVYKFAWDEEPDPFDFFIGAAHAMDLPFWFGNFITDKDSLARFAWSEESRQAREEISEAMMTYVAQFARSGDPNGGDPDLLPWTPWSNEPDTPRRIIFDTGELYLSSDLFEPQEAPCPSCTLKEIFNLIFSISGRYPESLARIFPE